MKIVKPYAKILSPTHADFVTTGVEGVMGREILRRIEWCARISHRSEDAQGEDSAVRFLKSVVINHGDWSVVEHVTLSVDFLVDRGITHEMVRHRIASYTQESTRFVNYEKKMPPSFVYPKPEIECEHCLSGDEPRIFTRSYEQWVHGPGVGTHGCSYSPAWLVAIREAEVAYKTLIMDKWRPQEARSVFPNALASRIVMTANLRSWRHFFIMRTTAEAHPQMRQVTIPLLEDFKRLIPVLYDDIEPNSKQSESMKKGR